MKQLFSKFLVAFCLTSAVVLSWSEYFLFCIVKKYLVANTMHFTHCCPRILRSSYVLLSFLLCRDIWPSFVLLGIYAIHSTLLLLNVVGDIQPSVSIIILLAYFLPKYDQCCIRILICQNI